ncbi:heterokaryon incompatibility protein-domain-containing protein [Cladorrhinum samala]|uniref:Heterokaryon incompatibility protein-domain-containing protein n=1 Tax=Cladorrhinum samala TaxID=585594 RepID=A0AAV9HQK2_9PEZI|nr:heterokaryon incompatibility protein-domain-containing protein [Cladorrhinum samala]
MAHSQMHTTCDDCVEIFERAAALLAAKPTNPEDDSLILFDSAYQLRLASRASSSECHMCILLSAWIPRLLEPLDPQEILALAVYGARHDPSATTVSLVGTFLLQNLRCCYPGSLRIQEARHGTVCVLNSSTTWSLETLNRIRLWMRTCTSSHGDCAKNRLAGRLPRRLIDVGTSDTAGKVMEPRDFDSLCLEQLPNVHIIPSDSLPPETQYLTLSHRWASSPQLLLTMDTLFLLDCDISPHLLSRSDTAVFQHAIHVTRGLGFRYLWIDALCIMQDNEPEKMADIVQMDQIYSNSALNISAVEGRIRDGLVLDRKPLGMNPCRSVVSVPSSTQRRHVCLEAFPEKWSLRLAEGPLNRRGWVFQERILAPRIVHFTADQVFWECHSLEASEVLPQGVPGPISPDPDFPSGGLKLSLMSRKSELRSRWYDLLEAYSCTSVTFVSDRLLAISGVARQFCSAMQRDPSEYLAGMWKCDLPLSMLWNELQQRPDTSGRSPTSGSAACETKRAPSWSWASLRASIQFAHPELLVAKAHVLDVQIARISPNLFDGADFCRLRLRCLVCRFRRRIQDGAPRIQVGQETEFQELSNLDFKNRNAIVISWDTSREAVARWLQASDDGPASAQPTQFLLHIATGKTVDGTEEGGIVLQRTALRGTYTRIGRFFIPSLTDIRGSELDDAFNGRLNTMSTDDYLEPPDSSGRCTIDII